MTVLRYCRECFAKQQRINQLTVENERLKAQWRSRERSAKEGPFGSSTPSSKIPFKPNAEPDPQERRGGGRRKPHAQPQTDVGQLFANFRHRRLAEIADLQ